ncbi:hypothetical protein MSAN_00565600 [Mycena sanguinolenta]|uniref:F-box domain-containing protein n=1 Tax=Mycena sanguinolenta TaxID=230812 RepID=A0A8H6Z9Z6_9AGAR|nr:hypothetical protein MSAN_00565600 [Mycena sanguinolenta]
MHPLLECAELFQAITSHLDHPALAALAITCKALCEPALDALWEELLDLDRVLALFPDDLFIQGSIARPILSTDWTRPYFYVSRVKTLQIGDFPETEILQSMSPFSISSGLFPNLRRFHCESTVQDLIPLRFLLHSQLKTISLSFPPSVTNLSFLSALAVVCPHLTHVDIWFGGADYHPEVATVISTLVLALKALEYLELDIGIHTEALNLGLLPNLKALLLSRLPTKLEAGLFPRLQDLTIHRVGVVAILKLICSAVDLELVKISLGLFPATTSPQMAELMRGLKSVASLTSLKTLTLRPSPSDVNTVLADVMTADALRELSFFCRLTTICIEWSFGTDLDDKTFEVLTASWTQLANLQLVHKRTDTNLTLKSLLALARNCPRLQYLGLKIDAREVPEPPCVAPQRTLKSMQVASSPIQSAPKVAGYLSGIFPDVEHISSVPSEGPFQQNPLWVQVSEQLPVFVAVRKEEAEKVENKMMAFSLVLNLGPMHLILQLQTLATLARTCRALKEPALDALWEYLCELDCVLNLFPPGLFVQGRLARPILAADWTRPRPYVSRVKKLSIKGSNKGYAQILQVMGPFCPSGGPFPNLRCLQCLEVWQDLTPLRVLLQQQLKEVSLHFPPSIINLSLLSALAIICPHLTHVDIHLDGGVYCPGTDAVISTVFPALEALECLGITVDFHVGELHLGSLPKLTDLFLCGPTNLGNGSFPCLRDLKIQDVDAVWTTDLFRTAEDVNLVSLSLGLFPATTTSQMAELVRVLKSVVSPTCLSTLRLRPARGNMDAMPAHVMTADALRELSFFRGLKIVIIHSSFGPDVDDETLKILSASWTCLTELELTPRHADNTSLTLKSLAFLAQNCPHLLHLHLKIDAREVPELPDVAPQGTLESLHVGSSPIQSAPKVARYLSAIFPNVEHIQSDHSEEFREHRQLWEEVLERVPHFVAVREEAGKVQSKMGDDGLRTPPSHIVP